MEIQGYPNYLIYPDGKVWSNKRKGRFLKPILGKNGYYKVTLSGDKTKIKNIHRLIAEHYIYNDDPITKIFVDHINRIKTDNRLENLRWVTQTENNNNVGVTIRSLTGIKRISYDKDKDRWRYKNNTKKNNITKYFKSKTDCLWFKFIFEI
jgi:hypothetical protein